MCLSELMARVIVRVDPDYRIDTIVRFESYANCYGTNPTDDTSAISMMFQNASIPDDRQPDKDAFLPNKANGEFGNDFNVSKIARLFSSSKPKADFPVVSVVSRNGSQHGGRPSVYRKPMANSRDVSM